MATHGGFDASTMGGAFNSPGIDPRQWASYGIVENDNVAARSVDFSESVGPLVNVRLQPSDIPVRCRVSSQVAGNGESEWHPFVQGDEVLVLIPNGDERNGCVIVGRLNNAIDSFPNAVASQDPTKNNFAFKRTRSPFVWETAGGWQIQDATTGAGIALDLTGNWTMYDGELNSFSLGASAGATFAIAAGGTFGMSKDGVFSAQCGQSPSLFFTLDPSTAALQTKGTFAVGTSGGNPSQHAITLEQVVNLFINYTVFLGLAGDPSTWTLSLFDPLDPTLQTLDGLIAAWISGAVYPTPPTAPPVYGGDLTEFVQTQAAIATALETPTIDGGTLTGISPVPFAPGIARPGFTL